MPASSPTHPDPDTTPPTEPDQSGQGRGDARVRGVLGAPSWVSLIVRDLDAAERFYGGLLGWTFVQGPERLGPFSYVVAGGHRVAGISAIGESSGIGMGWTAFFGVRDAHEGARRIADRGGTVGVGPVAIDAGRVVIARDPDGAGFGLWQGHEQLPESATALSGVPAWIELRTADAFKAALFYGEVLDWDPEVSSRCEVVWEHERVVLRVDGRNIAALGGPQRGGPEVDSPPSWRVSFAVPDIDLAVARAAELGGRVLVPPAPTPYGPVAELRDPEGSRFSLIQPPTGP
jgi:predicted enzyme related to lactoylglutathione lyase